MAFPNNTGSMFFFLACLHLSLLCLYWLFSFDWFLPNDLVPSLHVLPQEKFPTGCKGANDALQVPDLLMDRPYVADQVGLPVSGMRT